jgi:hypothetical protein
VTNVPERIHLTCRETVPKSTGLAIRNSSALCPSVVFSREMPTYEPPFWIASNGAIRRHPQRRNAHKRLRIMGTGGDGRELPGLPRDEKSPNASDFGHGMHHHACRLATPNRNCQVSGITIGHSFEPPRSRRDPGACRMTSADCPESAHAQTSNAHVDPTSQLEPSAWVMAGAQVCPSLRTTGGASGLAHHFCPHSHHSLALSRRSGRDLTLVTPA